jgi:hypothetical protein
MKLEELGSFSMALLRLPFHVFVEKYENQG